MTVIFFLFCVLSALFSVGAIILGGSNGLAVLKNYDWSMHYLHPAFLLPLFWAAPRHFVEFDFGESETGPNSVDRAQPHCAACACLLPCRSSIVAPIYPHLCAALCKVHR